MMFLTEDKPSMKVVLEMAGSGIGETETMTAVESESMFENLKHLD